MGVRNDGPATAFGGGIALAATWNRDLMYEVGVALAEECKQHQVSVILGPGANIKRSPLCGRNFEYFSEDPVLAGVESGEEAGPGYRGDRGYQGYQVRRCTPL